MDLEQTLRFLIFLIKAVFGKSIKSNNLETVSNKPLCQTLSFLNKMTVLNLVEIFMIFTYSEKIQVCNKLPFNTNRSMTIGNINIGSQIVPSLSLTVFRNIGISI